MLSGILAIALLGAPAAPSTPAPAPAPAKRVPGCTEPERHMLDYWLGDWDTFEPEGPPGESQARAHVDSILVGPASIEHLDAALDGCTKVLSPEVRARIDGVHRAYLGTDACYVR